MTLLQESRRLIDVPVSGDGLTADDITVSVTTGHSPVTFYDVDSYADGVARVLVGPGSDVGQLGAGLNRIFVRVAGMEPEDPQEYAGTVWVEGTVTSDGSSDGYVDGGGPDSFPDGDPE